MHTRVNAHKQIWQPESQVDSGNAGNQGLSCGKLATPWIQCINMYATQIQTELCIAEPANDKVMTKTLGFSTARISSHEQSHLWLVHLFTIESTVSPGIAQAISYSGMSGLQKQSEPH
jgi:hypothetical protein